MGNGIDLLTAKEKDTLRLIGRGHDAKSMARHLGLSVHTVNERLRVARRKLEVTSSREAARLLLERETPEPLVNKPLGDAGRAPASADAAPSRETGSVRRTPALVLAGVLAMFLALATLILLAAQEPAPTPAEATTAGDPAVVDAARSWLALVDAGRWRESFNATAGTFRKANTPALWQSASERARVPLGAVRVRRLIVQEFLPAPPRGYQVVKFRTDFAAKSQATETVVLEREASAYRVVSYVID